MTTRPALLLSLIIFIIFDALLRTCPTIAAESSTRERQAERPNIVLILTDDQEEGSLAFMPNLQQLVREKGTMFKNFVFNVPLCCPSRVSILRGQYAHNHRVITNRSPHGGFTRFQELGHEESTVATWLQDVGYRTAFFGKYLNGYPRGSKRYVPSGWDEWCAVVSGHYRNYELNENGEIFAYGSDPDDYETDVLARKAADFIRGAAGNTPFFIHLDPYAPHKPYFAAPRHQGSFQDESAPRPPSFNEPDVSDKPTYIQNDDPLGENDIAEIDKRYRGRLESLLAVDDLIKTVIDALQETNELDDTYLFFASDNGFHLGEHRRETGKNTPYEEVLRVPLMVRGPGVPEARVLEHLVCNVDLAPTFAELGGASVPEFVDGMSLAPLMSNLPLPLTAWRTAVVVQHWQFEGAGGSIPDYRGLRTPDNLYVEYATGELEFYDLQNDPYQLESLHSTADAELLQSLAEQLALLGECKGSGCTTTTAVPVKLSLFTAEVSKNSVHLLWTTTVENNSLGFEVQRSSNGGDFEPVSFVQSKRTAGRQQYLFHDSDLQVGRYRYRLRHINFDGSFEYSGTIGVEIAAPSTFSLAQNYPNPFNPETTIKYELSRTMRVVLTIYNLLGQKVKTLVDEVQTAGFQQVIWDGKNEFGAEVPTGLYVYRLQTDSDTTVRKLTLLR